MPVEVGDTIASLNEAWPAGAEPHSQGDDHLRLIKHVIKFDALSKTDGGSISGPVDLASGSTIGGAPIGSSGDLSGKADVIHSHVQSDITNLSSDLALKAPLANPVFSGAPTAPTATAGTNTLQIATTAFVTTAVAAVEGGGGGGSGDDLDTTPVAPTGSSLARTMPEWLAGAPVIEHEDAELLISEDHLGCWIHMMNDIGSLVMLPDDWPPGWSFGVRQQGTGIVLWQYVGGSTVQMPFSKSDHTGLAEQYEEAVFRVLSNADGHSAVWGVSGGTF